MVKYPIAAALLGLVLGAAASYALAGEPSQIAVKAAWLRATPHGATAAGGYATITNTGATPDRLVSASIASAPRGDVHRMWMENNVMHMARLDQGLALAAGETVTLAPGGYHLMFENPAVMLKEHDEVKGTLTFEKAGVVAVTFTVGGMAAKVAPEPASKGN